MWALSLSDEVWLSSVFTLSLSDSCKCSHAHLLPLSSLSFISCLFTLSSFSPSSSSSSGTSHKYSDMKPLWTFPAREFVNKNSVVEIEAVKFIAVFKQQIWLYWSVWTRVTADRPLAEAIVLYSSFWFSSQRLFQFHLSHLFEYVAERFPECFDYVLYMFCRVAECRF